MQGYGDNLFGPGDPVTREQLAMIFYNYAKFKGYDTTASGDLSGFTDAGDLSPWAQEAMKWAVGSGVMSGKGNGILDPKGHRYPALKLRLCSKTSLRKTILCLLFPAGMAAQAEPAAVAAGHSTFPARRPATAAI